MTETLRKPMRQSLYEMAKPSLMILRLIGYFPFTINRDFELTCNYFSLPFIWSLFLIIVVMTKACFFYLTSGSTALYRRSTELDKVEAFCQNLLAITALAVSLVCMGKGLLASKSAAIFWKTNSAKLEEFSNIQCSFEFVSPSSTYFSMFRQISIKSKAGAVVTLLYGLITPNTMFALDLTPTGVQRHRPTDTAVDSNSTWSWSQTLIRATFQASAMIPYLLICLTAYINLHLRIYSACFTIIAKELNKIVLETDEDGKTKLFIKSLGSLPECEIHRM